jgi:hypothetical protein
MFVVSWIGCLTEYYIYSLTRRVLIGHRFDNGTPVEEVVRDYYGAMTNSHCSSESAPQMQALHDVVQKGWVRYIGMSSCWAWQCKLFQLRVRCSVYSSDPSVQSTRCRVRTMGHSPFKREKLIHAFSRLRDQQSPHSFHLNAEPLQPHIPRGRA